MKFTEYEAEFIVDALAIHVTELELELDRLQEDGKKDGKRPIFAPGFFRMISKDIISKIAHLTQVNKVSVYDNTDGYDG